MRRLTIEPKSVLVIINIALHTVTNKASLIHGTSSADERIIEYDIDKVVFEAGQVTHVRWGVSIIQ